VSQHGLHHRYDMEGQTVTINALRAPGDVRNHRNAVGLNHAGHGSAGVLSGHFRRSTSMDESDACRRRVALAVARAKQGDREALRYLYVQYADNVYGYVVSILRDEHEAEDVTQHVFAKLMAVLPKYEQRAVPFTSWLLRLAHNAALDHLRRRLPTPAEEVRSPDEQVDRGRSENVNVISQALAALPEDQRTVVVLRHVVGLTPGEIAQRLGRSENSIHGLHHRGRRAVQQELRRLECGPVTMAGDRTRAAA
jgi:RNA polymerase sigma-70 factor, ECF subfamily